ncbi:MAG: transcription termination factor NusA [bacterium]|nr:transcription termination factor NusA [bacterium]
MNFTTVDQKQFLSALTQISEEKGISRERVIETIEMAVAAAYKREYGRRGQIVRAKMDPETGVMSFTQVKLIVEPSMLKTEEEIAQEEKEATERIAAAATATPEEKRLQKKREMEAEELLEKIPESEEEKKIRFNPEKHILLEDARKENKDIQVGEEFITSLETHSDFGRIAAQTAKQVIIQRIREAERDAIFAEYKGKEWELVSGIVQRIEGQSVFVDLGKTIATLFPEDQLPTENYRIGQRLRFLLIRVEMTPRGPLVLLSRSHPMVLRKLFALEVPEIAAGTVEIKSIAREGGSRTKVAVASKEEGIDPIGSCVGQRGTRVQTVINEIGGEKIDIVEWSENPEVFVAHALSPAKVLDVTLFPDERKAIVEVPPDQLSLAIGQKGQNVRLAAKLTGWKIDIKGAELPAEASVEEDVATEGDAQEATLSEPETETPASQSASSASEEIQPAAEEKVTDAAKE